LYCGWLFESLSTTSAGARQPVWELTATGRHTRMEIIAIIRAVDDLMGFISLFKFDELP
jgi:hypothetical protein